MKPPENDRLDTNFYNKHSAYEYLTFQRKPALTPRA